MNNTINKHLDSIALYIQDEVNSLAIDPRYKLINYTHVDLINDMLTLAYASLDYDKAAYVALTQDRDYTLASVRYNTISDNKRIVLELVLTRLDDIKDKRYYLVDVKLSDIVEHVLHNIEQYNTCNI